MHATSEHVGSYYAATVNEKTDFAPLSGSVKADVCVIGAGFTGISTALHLVKRGYDVHVVEASKVGWGASGRNGGQMIGGIAGEHARLRHHGSGTARLLADAIAGTFERFDIFAKIKPLTVPGSNLFSKQMVALGMIYYRLEDLLQGIMMIEGGCQFICGNCGAQLLVDFKPESDVLYLTMGTVGGNPDCPPDYHQFAGSKAPWHEIMDGRPQHDTWPDE